MARWVESLAGVEVRITGDFRRSELGKTQPEVIALLEQHGARVVSDVRSTTELLVRADSPNWKHGEFGQREEKLAKWGARGHSVGVLEVEDLMALLGGTAVFARDPLAPPDDRPPIGVPYMVATAASILASEQPVVYDPAKLERASHGHAEAQNTLARFVEALGHDPLSPIGTIQFDLAWRTDQFTWVAEVKSLHASNETTQLRVGLGQVLEYRWRLELRTQHPVRAVVMTERAPVDDDWLKVCSDVGVLLVWPDRLDAMLFV